MYQADHDARHIRQIDYLAPKLVKWYKSGTFSDQTSVHYGSVSKTVLKVPDLYHLGQFDLL